MSKKTKLWKIVGCSWTWQTGVFCLLFSGFTGFVVWFFVCLVKLQNVKHACFFPNLGGFFGEASSWLCGFGWFSCFCGSCFCFSFVQVLFLFLFRSGFVFVYFGIVFVLLLDCCWCCSCLLFLCFLFLVYFLLAFCFCLEGLRVRWGGPKGHLTWP